MTGVGLGFGRLARRLVFLGAFATWFAGYPASGSAQTPPVNVGSETCTACHATEATAWTGSHHDWALKPPEDPWVLGDFSGAVFEHKGKTARFSREGDAFVVDLAEPGAPDRRLKVVWAVGVTPLQQYLVETEPGRLQALDVAWDTEAKRWFDLYPDQALPPGDGLHWSGPYKTWNARCADCHHTGFSKGYDPATRRYASTWSEPAVTCEACHGPGSLHVDWAKARKAAPGSESAVLAGHAGLTAVGLTAALDTARAEIERCAQCHSRREDLTGKSPVPGTPFADAYRLSRLTPGLYFPDGQDRDEVYIAGAFLQSRMHAAGVRCSDCHDPHTATLKAEGNAVCTACHTEAGNPAFPTLRKAVYDDPSHHRHSSGSEGAACVACHMPVRTYMQVDPRHDHGFRIPRPDVSGPAGAPDTCTSCHADRDWRWAADAIAGWYPEGRHTRPHFGTLFAEADADGPAGTDVIDRLASYATDLANPAIVRASAIDRIDAPTLADLDRIRPLLADPDPSVRSAAINLHRGAPADLRVERLVPLLDDPLRAVRIDAARTLIDVSPEAFPSERADAVGRAMAEFQANLTANADAPETQMAIGGVALTLRNAPAAAGAFREAAMLDPGLVEAWRMAARIAWATGDTETAARTVDEGIAANPKSAPLLQVKAALQAATGDVAGAVSTYEDAVSAAPDDIALRIEYADYLASGGAHPRALDILTPMLGRFPDDPDLLFLIARSAVAAGRAPVAKTAIAAFRRSNPGHPLEPEIDRLAAQVP